MNKKQRREAVRMKCNGKCAYCGVDLPEKWHVDHLEPVQRQPYGKDKGKMDRPERDVMDNLMPSCPPCNNYKHSMTLDVWREFLDDLPNNLERNNNTYRHALRFGLVEPKRKPVTFYFETFTTPKTTK